MNLKKIITTSLAAVLLAGVGAGMDSTIAHGANLGLDQYPSSWEKRAGITHWGVTPSRSYVYKGRPRVKYRAKTFRKGHHTYKIKDVFDAPGVIIGMDGNTHVSNYKVLHSLEGRHVKNYRIEKGHPNLVVTRHHAVKHHRRHVRKTRRHYARKHRRRSHRRY